MTTSTLAIPALHATAAQALSVTTTSVSLGVVAFMLILLWVLHHKAAPKHHWIELFAKIVLMAGVLVMFVVSGFGASWILGINNWTGTLFNKWSHGKWGTSFGALTILEGALIGVLIAHVVSLVRRKNDKGSAQREATPWYDAFERFAHRYGYALVGPLSVTLPAGVGALIAGSLMDLSMGILHAFSHLWQLA